jgi:small subunit ribosomal protein S7
VLTKFMNSVMYDGKKSVAETSSMARSTSSSQDQEGSALEVFHEALDNVAPAIEVRSRRVGGATYQVRSKSARSARRRWPSAG